jgi:hypothetical protein
MPDLRWNPEYDIGDVLTLVGFTFTILGLVFAGFELRRNARVQKAQFLLDITERYFSDTDVRKFYYKLDYNKFTLDFNKLIGSDEERWLDSLLYTFDLIGRLVKMRAVTGKEVDVLAFQASRVLRNSEVVKYLNWLDGEYEREGRPTPAHADARFLVETLFRAKRLKRDVAA